MPEVARAAQQADRESNRQATVATRTTADTRRCWPARPTPPGSRSGDRAGMGSTLLWTKPNMAFTLRFHLVRVELGTGSARAGELPPTPSQMAPDTFAGGPFSRRGCPGSGAVRRGLRTEFNVNDTRESHHEALACGRRSRAVHHHCRHPAGKRRHDLRWIGGKPLYVAWCCARGPACRLSRQRSGPRC